MPSPFPGMDPYLEGSDWTDFHHAYIEVLREQLVPLVDPRYVVRVERRVYVETNWNEQPRAIIPDFALLDQGQPREIRSSASSAVLEIRPVECLVPMPQEFRESFLIFREQATMKVVTVLELLSPNNKRAGSKGRRKYLRKRKEVLESRSHLVELDLLRGGERLPLGGPVPNGDYYAIVSRYQRRPKVEVYAWTLGHRLPTLPIPLKKGDPDVSLDLQAAFDLVYDRVRYDRTLRYGTELNPPLSPADADWAAPLIEKWRASRETAGR